MFICIIFCLIKLSLAAFSRKGASWVRALSLSNMNSSSEFTDIYSSWCVTCVCPAVCLQSSHAELMMMESRKTSLLGRAESLKRSTTELPSDFHNKLHNLTHTWGQLEVTHTQTHKYTIRFEKYKSGSLETSQTQRWYLEHHTDISVEMVLVVCLILG